jgi:hypothetical protein
MTDRVSSLTVVLKEDWRDDEVDRVVLAIRMAPVLSVTANVQDPFSEHVASMRLRQEYRAKLFALLEETQ